ncbi:MAG: dihydroxyacetone kinase subunit DhaK [Rikenellaceae bacterium]
MKTKFINDSENITAELLEGYTLAFKDIVKLGGENIVVRTNAKSGDKVAVVAFGGSGHEPAVSGFVGEGMLDCSVVGDIFAAPGAQRLFAALQMFKREAGIVLLVLNHSGDVMSGNMAMQLASRMGIKVKSIITHDDISAGLDAADDDRRGLAGAIVMYKVLGAAAEAGKSLDEIIEIGERLNKNIATLAVATGSCSHPQNGMVITEMEKGKMQIGMGQHGEAGQGGTENIVSADDTATRMVSQLMAKLVAARGDKMLLYINGVGSSTLMEQFIVYRAAAKVLEDAGVEVVHGHAGELLTVQESGGFQMILARLDSDHVDYLKNYKANAPYWKCFGK